MSEFEAEPVTEEQLRIALAYDEHPTAKFDVIPKFLFNLEVLPE